MNNGLHLILQNSGIRRPSTIQDSNESIIIERMHGDASAEAVTPLKQGVNNNQFHDEDFSPEVDEMIVRSPESRYAE